MLLHKRPQNTSLYRVKHDTLTHFDCFLISINFVKTSSKTQETNGDSLESSNQNLSNFMTLGGNTEYH